ncbi:hypothetical protein DCCM_2421 [Desulfocucumis palustris]|uniref:Uncharacterized protein n=1 Tax=Desulfocucumis palustris TaxID=1898651 RepID=A0A2L2XB77_9FIRM|nr:hypothetical protein DCCM_2421 [Desulfocucumis palustris]
MCYNFTDGSGENRQPQSSLAAVPARRVRAASASAAARSR